jgi:hypothetical protein
MGQDGSTANPYAMRRDRKNPYDNDSTTIDGNAEMEKMKKKDEWDKKYNKSEWEKRQKELKERKKQILKGEKIPGKKFSDKLGQYWVSSEQAKPPEI